MSNRPQYVFKKHPSISLLDDPLGVFPQASENVLHVEDIRSYIHCKIEIIGDEDIQKDLGTMCNCKLSLNFEYVHLSELNLVKYIFYTEFDNHDWI